MEARTAGISRPVHGFLIWQIVDMVFTGGGFEDQLTIFPLIFQDQNFFNFLIGGGMVNEDRLFLRGAIPSSPRDADRNSFRRNGNRNDRPVVAAVVEFPVADPVFGKFAAADRCGK